MYISERQAREFLISCNVDISHGNSVTCDESQLVEGGPDVFRCQVDNELPGYEIGPDTLMDTTQIRRYSFMAFLRLFYHQILDSE